ncbi:hypothetical protein PlfCFBP13513_19090 [Plantibacter flavus]|uniref:helix-turn-helix transcriptional regulator n=1 Tax=Plantibacter flavus TaxID=150123 RepID=UPI001133E08A|nr:hypothetical protein PlfCFBP13513_19090 [Plantibacter flavus]
MGPIWTPPRGYDARTEEFQRLLEVVERRTPQVLLVIAPFGFGKSWLLNELAAHSPATAALVTASRHEVDIPLSGLSACVAGMSTLFGLEQADRLESMLLGDRNPVSIARNLLAVLRGIDTRELLLLIDDVDCFDLLSQQVLAYVLRRLVRPGLQVVLTCSQEPDDLSFDGIPTEMMVPLPTSVINDIVEQELGATGPVVAATISLVASGSAGLAVAICHSLTEGQRTGTCAVAFPELLPAPAAVRVLRELPECSSGERLFLEIVSSAWEVSRTALDELFSNVDTLLAPLIEGGLLVSSGSTVRFRQLHRRAAVYQALRPADREQLHERLAVLERGAMQVWHRSFVRPCAAEVAKMLRWSRAVLLSGEDVRLAVELVERGALLGARFGLDALAMARVAEAFALRYELGHADRYAILASRSGRRIRGEAALLLAWVRAVAQFQRVGAMRSEPLLEVTERYESVAPAATVRLHELVALGHLERWELDSAARHLRSAMAVAERTTYAYAAATGGSRDINRPDAHALTQAGVALIGVLGGEHCLSFSPDGGSRPTHPGFRSASAPGTPTARPPDPRLLLIDAVRQSHLGRFDDARRTFLRVGAQRDPRAGMMGRTAVTYTVCNEIRAGRMRAALGLINEHLSEYPERPHEEPRWAFLASWFWAERGNAALAERCYRRGRVLTGDVTTLPFRFYLDARRAVRRAYVEPTVEVLDELRRMQAASSNARNPELLRLSPDVIEVAAMIGDTAAVKRELEQFQASCEAFPSRWAELALARSRVLALRGDDANEACANLVDRFRAEDSPYELARTLAVSAFLFERSGFPSRARESAVLAVAEFEAQGLMTWVELVENRYVAADQPKVPGALGDLNDVQREIVDLVAAGYRNREIANQLHVSLRTVELRLTGVYRRLRIASRSQLIALSAAEGAPQVAASSAAAR